MSATIDRATGKPATAYTPPEDVIPCPTCTGRSRETVGMVCQTCGTDYGAPEPDAYRDKRGCIRVNLRKHPALSGVFDAAPTAAPLWLTDEPNAAADLIAAITALRDRARDTKHGGKVTVHEITALLPEEHR